MVEILIQMAPFHYRLLKGRLQVTHRDKCGEKGFPPALLHFKIAKQDQDIMNVFGDFL